MRKEIKVSVILPSLNVASYIKECVESVLNQSLKEIEIICVDAGSTDGTLEILRQYEKKDDRLEIIVSDKKSYGYQMNLGIRHAVGEYVGIVETDDYIKKEMYEELYCAAKKNMADFVKSDFYRFTGESDMMDKVLFQLTGDSSFYNRVINIENEQECFNFHMNTWSGIYNRRFLLEHEIFHNETPGAAFQDNGFWFQTFVYAKRALFLNKAYYMNRRDNLNSSVYDKSKMFCVCDEFEFIEDILRKDQKLFQAYKYTYTYICFKRYKKNLDRVIGKYQKEYIKLFSKKFQIFYKEGSLNSNLFSDQDWEMLISIINEPASYYEHTILPKQKVLDQISNYETVIIYGVGHMGKKTYRDIWYHVNPKSRLYFAVSNDREHSDFYQGIPICNIGDLVQYRESALVIITVSKANRQNVYDILEKTGFAHMMIMP